MALGATNVQVCTAAMVYGFKIVDDMIDGLDTYLDGKGITRVGDLVRAAVPSVTDWQYLNLNHIDKAYIDQEKCIKCGRCYIACEDTSHQAITCEVNGSRRFEVKNEECVGCNLCVSVCPVEGCITLRPLTEGVDPRTRKPVVEGVRKLDHAPQQPHASRRLREDFWRGRESCRQWKTYKLASTPDCPRWVTGSTAKGCRGRVVPSASTIRLQARRQKQSPWPAKRPSRRPLRRPRPLFPAWRNTPPAKRARVMFRFKELLEANAERLCQLLTEEHGKVLNDAMGELERGIENVEFACGAPELLKGEHTKNVSAAVDSWSEFQPLGVVGGITPFNFPIMVPLWMYPSALVCGNTFVLKPSEKDPSSAIFGS